MKFIEKIKYPLVLMLSIGWIFSGWPQIFNFPPSIGVSKAAITAPTSRGNGTTGTGNTDTFTAYPNATIAVGKVVLVALTTDNSSTTSGCDGNLHSVTGSAGNVWTKILECTDTDGSQDDGNTTSLFISKLTTQMTTGTGVSITFPTTRSDVIMSFTEITFPAGKTWAVQQIGLGQNSVSASVSGMPSREYLLFGLLGAEGEDTAKTPGTNYTERHDLVSTTAGQAHANVQQHVQTRIATLTGDTVTTSAMAYTNAVATLTAIFEVDDPTFEQSAYRFFDNNNSTGVGSALGALNTPATLLSTGAQFRLRQLLHIGGTNSIFYKDTADFKLQFATRSGTCDTGFAGESYSDITTSTAIAYYDNSTPSDGDNLTSNANDPTHSGHAINNQTYEESNNFTNSISNISTGQDGKWDFSLFDNGAPAGTSYCFRIRRSNDTNINTYTVIPEITTHTVTAARPIASAVSVDSGASAINLNEGTTKNVSCTATVTDTDGFADITSVQADLYNTSLGSASALNDNNHYRLSGDANCVPSGGSGNTETYTCNFSVQFFAEPTDAGSPDAGDDWTCKITPSDSVGVGTEATDGIEINSLSAISVTPSIAYGAVNPNTTTGASNQTTTVTNTGNRSLDIQLSGTTMTSGGNTIAISNQEYGSSGFTYGSGIDLSGTPTTLVLALPKPTSTNPVTANVFWGLGVDNGQAVGTYNGTNTFTVVAD